MSADDAVCATLDEAVSIGLGGTVFELRDHAGLIGAVDAPWPQGDPAGRSGMPTEWETRTL